MEQQHQGMLPSTMTKLVILYKIYGNRHAYAVPICYGSSTAIHRSTAQDLQKVKFIAFGIRKA